MTATDPATSHRRSPRTGRRWARRAAIVLGVLLALVGVVAAAAYYKLDANITSKKLAPHVAADDTPKGAMNILFIGSDSRDLKSGDGYGKGNGTRRSDSLMLVHFSKGNTRIDAVQIPRDTMLDMPSCPDTGDGAFGGGYGQINSALQFGQSCSVRTVEQLSGVHIDHFVELDFDGFASMVNALGGVGVCLPEPLQDSYAKLDLPAGKQKLDGKDALALARTRHAVGDGSDIGRIGHQQMVMSAIIHRAKSTSVLTRPDKLYRFLSAVTKSITVDEGISSIRELTKLAQRARSVDTKNITFIAMPSAAAPTDPNRVVPTEAATTVFKAIAKDRAPRLAGDDAEPSSPIRVLNAARTPGLATTAQRELQALDYTVAELADAEQQSGVTRIFVDGSDESIATAKALNKDFGFKAEIVNQGSQIDGVWLIIGTDRVSKGLEPVDGEPVEATSRHADDDLCS